MSLSKQVTRVILATCIILGMSMASIPAQGKQRQAWEARHSTIPCLIDASYCDEPLKYVHYDEIELVENDKDLGRFTIKPKGNYMGYTMPYYSDVDCDGLTNYYEWFVMQGNPLSKDYDNDGYADGYEFDHRMDPFSNEPIDIDGDGVSNVDEIGDRTFPRIADSDADSLTDYQELVVYHTDALVADTDADGLFDAQEIAKGTDPRNNDTDGDAMPDGWEANHFLDALFNDAGLDADNDLLANIQEYIFLIKFPLIKNLLTWTSI